MGALVVYDAQVRNQPHRDIVMRANEPLATRPYWSDPEGQKAEKSATNSIVCFGRSSGDGQNLVRLKGGVKENLRGIIVFGFLRKYWMENGIKPAEFYYQC